MSDAPLWAAIKKLRRAKAKKANPKMIDMLETRVKDEALKVTESLNINSIEELKEKFLKDPV